jgi:hypothetical protein
MNIPSFKAISHVVQVMGQLHILVNTKSKRKIDITWMILVAEFWALLENDIDFDGKYIF